MNRELKIVTIPRGVVTVPDGDPARVKLNWRVGLVRLMLQHKEEERDGEKEEKE